MSEREGYFLNEYCKREPERTIKTNQTKTSCSCFVKENIVYTCAGKITGGNKMIVSILGLRRTVNLNRGHL